MGIPLELGRIESVFIIPPLAVNSIVSLEPAAIRGIFTNLLASETTCIPPALISTKLVGTAKATLEGSETVLTEPFHWLFVWLVSVVVTTPKLFLERLVPPLAPNLSLYLNLS